MDMKFLKNSNPESHVPLYRAERVKNRGPRTFLDPEGYDFVDHDVLQVSGAVSVEADFRVSVRAYRRG